MLNTKLCVCKCLMCHKKKKQKTNTHKTTSKTSAGSCIPLGCREEWFQEPGPWPSLEVSVHRSGAFWGRALSGPHSARTQATVPPLDVTVFLTPATTFLTMSQVDRVRTAFRHETPHPLCDSARSSPGLRRGGSPTGNCRLLAHRRNP